MDPFQVILREWKGTKERRTDGEWIYRGADIVDKARQGQLRRAHASTDGFLSFINDYGFAVLSQRNRGCKTVRSGADYDRVICRRLGHFNFSVQYRFEIFSKLRVYACAALVMHAKRSITNFTGANHLPILSAATAA